MKKIEENILNYMKENIFLNKQRYEKAKFLFNDIKQFLLNKKDYAKIELQGSFATKTAIKPQNTDSNKEYDIDALVLFNKGKYDKSSSIEFLNARDQLKNDLKEFCVSKNLQVNFKYKSKCITLILQEELSIDITPIFILNDDDSTKCIYDFEKKIIEKSETIALTNRLVDNMDINKRICIMIIKKLIKISCNDSIALEYLSSIGISLMHIDGIVKNESFSIKQILANLETVLQIKKGELRNPYDSQEEFYEKNGHKDKWKEHLIAIDRIRETLKKVSISEDFKLFKKIFEECLLLPSNGIDESTGSGGHA